jgi:hypothetical protein
MQHMPPIWEQRCDPSQVPGWIATIVPRLHSVVVAHDPGANHAAILRDKKAAREFGKARVAIDPLLPVHFFSPKWS